MSAGKTVKIKYAIKYDVVQETSFIKVLLINLLEQKYFKPHNFRQVTVTVFTDNLCSEFVSSLLVILTKWNFWEAHHRVTHMHAHVSQKIDYFKGRTDGLVISTSAIKLLVGFYISFFLKALYTLSYQSVFYTLSLEIINPMKHNCRKRSLATHYTWLFDLHI